MQADKAMAVACLVAPRLFIIAACVCERWSNPAREWTVLVKAGMAETGAANINTRSGQSIRDAVA